jgi:hypothetical protein
MRALKMALVLAAASLAMACTTSDSKPKTGAAGAAGSGQAGTGAGTAGAGTAGTGSGTAGSGTAGSGTAGAGNAGASGVAGSGSAGSTTGTAGAATDGGAGAPSKDAATERNPDSGPVTTAGCANHNYQLCIDFENGIDATTWTGGTPGSIVTDEVAHGTHAYHLYASGTGKGGVPKMTAGRLLSTKVGTIKNQVWSRFYIHFSPGAPGGHQNIVAAYDVSSTWYEMGIQFDGLMGVWHGGGGEHPRRSKPLIVDQWYCVEAYFDGAAAAMPRWFVDGAEAGYYEPMKANGTTVGEAGPTPTVSTQFTRLEAGLTSYAGLELKQPDTVGDQTETRVLTDLWIDDIAFDTQRIGCIE